MMNLSEKIEQYIEGELDEKEKQEFERQINEDPELKKLVQQRIELNQLLIEAISYNPVRLPAEEDQSELSRIQELETNDDLFRFYHQYKGKRKTKAEDEMLTLIRNAEKNEKVQRRSFSFFLSIAATLSLIFLIATAIIQLRRERNIYEKYGSLYSEYFNPGNDPHVNEMINESGFSSLDQALKKISAEKKISSSDIVRNDHYNQSDVFFLALGKMQKKDWDEAEILMDYLIDKSKGNINETAIWYHSLLLVRNGKINKVMPQLKEICANYSKYTEESCALVEKLSGS